MSDENGNVTDNGTQVFGWDYRNRLRVVNSRAGGTPVASYAYDALDRRARKQVAGSGKTDQTTGFFYDGWQVLQEGNGTGGFFQQYVYGSYIDEPLVMDRNLGEIIAGGSTAQRLFYHQNTLSSTFALTGSAGSVQEVYQYDAFGKATVFDSGPVMKMNPTDFVGPGPGVGGSFNPYLFTGRRLDDETGLYYYRYRYLDPDQGRFVQRDPLSIRGGDSGSEYTYTGDNPVNLQDWSGLRPTVRAQDRTLLDLLAARLRAARVGEKKKISCTGLPAVARQICNCMNKAKKAHVVSNCVVQAFGGSKSGKPWKKHVEDLVKLWKQWKRKVSPPTGNYTGLPAVCHKRKCTGCYPDLW